MSNRLSRETSPYLLQHQHNPVDWYPWGAEALERAKREDKPIFLSIGYSACHWCHVMEHESFESEETAALLNERFVCIKVDREERPDLDQIYMHAVQMLTGRGGWPMSVFLTPDGRPFFGGTYYPPEPRYGMPSFKQVVLAVYDAWEHRREQAVEQAGQITERLRDVERRPPSDDEDAEYYVPRLSADLLTNAVKRLEQSFDFTHGGFGNAPKFPHPIDLSLLLRQWFRHRQETPLKMVCQSLDKMAAGGIYDHLGGGFARYSVDERWLVPHFEKMLYDNALLSGAYLDGYLATGNEAYARVARETFDYILRDMTDERGGFYSTEDADSEGVEGKFYVWTVDEIHELLGEEAAERFCYVYDASLEGNFEGHSILNLPKTITQCAQIKGWDAEELQSQLAQGRRILFAAREKRIHPGKDDKILVNWNGLMIDSLARAAAAFSSEEYLQSATRAAEFILEAMRYDGYRLWHTYRNGKAHLMAYLDDYAALANGLVSLYEASFDERWIEHAVNLADAILKHFRDQQGQGFFFTAADHETLIARNKDLHDSSVPSASGLAATVLWRLGKLCGRADYLTAARETLEGAIHVMEHQSPAAGQLLIALDMLLGPTPEIAILGNAQEGDTAAALADLRGRYFPNRVLACREQADAPEGTADLDPLFIGKQLAPPEPNVYVCENFTCGAPVRGLDSAKRLWWEMSRSKG